MSCRRPLNTHSFTGIACKVAIGYLGLSHSFLTNLPIGAPFLYPIQQIQAAGALLGGRWQVPFPPHSLLGKMILCLASSISLIVFSEAVTQNHCLD